MTRRSSLVVGLLASAPWLCGADGGGCSESQPPAAMHEDAGAKCEAKQGERCGGNVAHPCACSAGLVCSSGMSGLPIGDVGGTCERPASAGAGSSVSGAGASANAGSSAGGRAAPDAGPSSAPDSGLCVSQHAEPCGGNALHPCSCASGLICTAKLGGPASGDVGGTCQSPDDAADGGMCVSDEGEHCGGNTNSPCSCATGLVCTPTSTTRPFGDVGGTCLAPKGSEACASASDCRLEADYCTGCDCRALTPGQSLPPCAGPGVRCLVDPCGTKAVACENGKCVFL